MATAVPLLADRLAETSVLLADTDTLDRADDYLADVLAAERDVISILDSIPSQQRVLMTDAEGLGHFGERYDFSVVDVGTDGRRPGEPAGAIELATLGAELDSGPVDVVVTGWTASSLVAGQLRDHI